MSVTFLVVPQWQGTGSSRAMQLVDGARAIAGDLPAASTRDVEVPLEAGDDEGTGIHRWSSIRIVRQRVAQALEDVDGPVVTIGGGCGADLGPIAHAAAQAPMALVWLDAHGDANSPATSSSGIFDGMVLRTVIDEGLVPADRVVHAGARNWDDGEREALEAEGARIVPPEALADPGALAAAVAATGADRAYVHLDVDVLDPSELASTWMPEPFGPTATQLAEALRELWRGSTLAGAAVTGFSPADAQAVTDEMPVLLRLIGALTAGARS